MTRSAKLFVALGLVFASGIAAPGCVVRGSGSMSASTTPVVYQEPPQPQVEAVSARPGYVWVRGRWDWRNGQWNWVGGHWERERAGYAWSEGRWERRGNSWHWIAGNWSASGAATVDVSNQQGGVMVTDTHPGHHDGHPGHHGGGTVVDVSNQQGGVMVTETPRGGGTTVTVGGSIYPTVAPPPPRAEASNARAGYVWVSGRWDWRNGAWAWVDGHWERQRANQVWVAGRWELQGNYYVWVEGRWDTRQQGPQVRDHR